VSLIVIHSRLPVHIFPLKISCRNALYTIPRLKIIQLRSGDNLRCTPRIDLLQPLILKLLGCSQTGAATELLIGYEKENKVSCVLPCLAVPFIPSSYQADHSNSRPWIMSWSPLEISLRLRQAIYETVAASALSTTPRNYVVSPAGEDPLRPFTVTVCTGQCNHPDELRPACETLLRHVRSHLRQGTRQSYHPSNVDEESSYLPESAVDKIFSEKNKNLVFDAIEELTPRHRRGVAAGVSPTTLRECYRKILLILLDLPRKYWSHIRHFTRHPELADKYLPFFSRPSNFPASDDEELWNIFEDAQWRFCAPRLRYTRDHVWGSKWILPFRIISELGRGRSGKIWAIEVDPEYDSLQVRNSSNLASSAGRTSPSQPRTYALKLFHSNGNDFENESHAYTELRASVHASNMHACGVVSYFGSFEHGDSAAIIFERATRNLETLLQTTQPTTDRAIWETWRGTFNLFISLRTLAAMGCERRPEEMFHMWHNDVCPKNTLVFGEPGAAIDIKLADLGLAHFRRIFTEQTTGLDQRGSVVYGAPEVFRWGINSMRGPTPARQNTEVWSVACMMSELAVWITLGPNGVQEYRQRRRNTQENQSHERPGLFHQNGDVSPAVTDMHTDILSSPASRPITRAVIQKLLNHMLCPADVRYDANVLHVIASGILDDHHYERNRQSPDDDDDNNPDDPSDPNGHQRSRPELSSEDDKNRHEDTDSCSGPSHISPPGGPSGRSDGQESEVCLPVQDHNTDEHSGKQPIPSSRMHRRRSESAPTCLFNNPDPFREKSQRDGGHDKIVVHVADGLDPKNLGPDETKGGQSTASANGDAPIVRGVNCGCQKKTSESDNGNLDPETVSNLSASIQRLRTPIPDVKSKTGHRLLKRMSAIPNVVGFPKMEIHPVGPEMKDHEIDQQRQIKQWPREQTRTKRDCQIALTQFWTSELENRTIVSASNITSA